MIDILSVFPNRLERSGAQQLPLGDHVVTVFPVADSDIEVPHVHRILLDELASRFYLVTHEHAE